MRGNHSRSEHVGWFTRTRLGQLDQGLSSPLLIPPQPYEARWSLPIASATLSLVSPSAVRTPHTYPLSAFVLSSLSSQTPYDGHLSSSLPPPLGRLLPCLYRSKTTTITPNPAKSNNTIPPQRKWNGADRVNLRVKPHS
jgi:hypothetical protein